MSHLDKHSNYIDQRKRLQYNNGGYVQIGDSVIYGKKLGSIVNFDRQTVNIKLSDGSEASNISIHNIRKASSIDNILNEAQWIK